MPPAVPATEVRLIALLMPVPKVKVASSAKVTAPRVIAPVAVPPIVVLADTLTGVVPKLMALVELLAAIVPAKYLVLGAIAVRPLVKVKVPAPPLAPNVKVPVFLKVTASVIVPLAALRAKL